MTHKNRGKTSSSSSSSPPWLCKHIVVPGEVLHMIRIISFSIHKLVKPTTHLYGPNVSAIKKVQQCSLWRLVLCSKTGARKDKTQADWPVQACRKCVISQNTNANVFFHMMIQNLISSGNQTWQCKIPALYRCFVPIEISIYGVWLPKHDKPLMH